MKIFTILSILICSSFFLYAQKENQNNHLPIIDVHVHASKVNHEWAPFKCPWELTSMPGADPNDKTIPEGKTDCLDPIMIAKNDSDLQEEVIKRIIDWNMTIFAFGDAEILHSWVKAAPKGRIIPGIGIDDVTKMSVKAFRDSLSNGFYKVMAEVAPQYSGKSPSDPAFDPYFAVAEELNIPVGIHMGTGGNGNVNMYNPKYRASMGNPFLLEELLARHPKLKIWVMHAGYPMADEMIALMGANAYVFLDVAGFIWSYPLDEVHYYIKRLIQAGFEKRMMYGTDFFMYPRLFETGFGVIENAQYLSDDQKRDILFNNAALFFRMDKSQFNWPAETN